MRQIKLESVTHVDSELLEFLTKYLKHVLYNPRFGSLDHLYDLGTLVKTSQGEYGIIAGYCGVGYEYMLYESDTGSKGYQVRGTENLSLKKVKLKDYKEHLPLIIKFHDYILNNQVKISTSHFKVCYEHWQRTGQIEFRNPKANEMIGEIDKLEKEINKTKRNLNELQEKYTRIVR